MSVCIKLSLTLIVSCCIVGRIMAMRAGGITDKEVVSDERVQAIVACLGSEIKSAAFATFSGSDGSLKVMEDQFMAANITALAHKTQVVAGTNYFVRAKIGDNFFHVRIYQDLKRNSSLSKVVGPKEESDPIEYF